MSLVEQELATPPVNPNLLRFYFVAESLVFCVVFCKSLIVPSLFCFAIVLSILRFTASDYPFGIFILPLCENQIHYTKLTDAAGRVS